uniref:Uncharacterized protein n=1 Tax=Meloidogyne floridensis TaxID=298350 RepID=A0A915NTJ4_9BILA
MRPKYQIKEGDAKIITFKIIDLIKEKLFQENNLGEEEEENIVNQETKNFINISYESWEKAKKIILGKSKLFKERNNDDLVREIKEIKYKKSVKKLKLKKIKKEIENKYEIEEFNEFD